MKAHLLALTITTLTLPPAFCAEDSKTINPALLYWQAASELPQFSDDQAKELADVATGRKAFDAAKDNELLKSDTTRRLLQKAAASTADCDWGLPMEDGPATLLPHLSKMRQMSSLALVQAEAFFAEGKVKEGIDWLLVAHRMARHAGAGDLLINYLVQELMETSTIRVAARHCLSWDSDARHSYAAELQALPPLHSAQAAFHGERSFIDWVERHTDHSGGPDAELQAAIASITPDQSRGNGGPVATLTAETLKADIPVWRDLQTRVEAALGKPWLQAQPELQAITDEVVNSPHPLVRIAFPTKTAVAERSFIVTTLRTMLDAALQYGPQLDEAAAATYHDSLEGEPLHLQKDTDGALTLNATRKPPGTTEINLKFGK